MGSAGSTSMIGNGRRFVLESRGRSRDVSPTREGGRIYTAPGQRRSLSSEYPAPSTSAAVPRRVSPQPKPRYTGESTPVAHYRDARQVSRDCRDNGHPTGALFSPVCAAGLCKIRSQSSPPCSRIRPCQPSITIPQFDGKGDLQIFLSKFTTIAEVFNWSDIERAQRLRLQLVSNAESVLWAIDEDCKYSEIVAELKRRFGSEQTTFHHRHLLRTMRQGRNESLSDLYSRVIRQTALAFPTDRGLLTELIARDSFISALLDPEIKKKLWEADPQNLQSAYELSSRYTTVAESMQSDSRYARHVKRTKHTHR